MTTQLSETMLSNLGGIEQNNLISILDIDTNEVTQMPPSLYFEIDELKTLRNTTGAKNQLSILSMNIQSIHAKFQELDVFIETLQNVDFKFNIICLQECWLPEQSEYNCIQLPGYDCVAQGRSSSTSGGLITYVDNNANTDPKLTLTQHLTDPNYIPNTNPNPNHDTNLDHNPNHNYNH